MNSITVDDIISTINKKEVIDPYLAFDKYPLVELARELNDILDDDMELKKIISDDYYRSNIIDLAQFVYTKYLAQREEKQPGGTHIHLKHTSLLSDSSLSKLYSFAS